ncbi:unnamed protein product [Caenorhabditis brenneri]
MTNQISNEISSNENDVNKVSKDTKFTIAEERGKILKNLQKCEESEREVKVREAAFEFFNEDNQKSKMKQEDPQDDVNVYEMILIMLQYIPGRKKPIGRKFIQWFLDGFVMWLEENNNEEELKKEQLTEYMKGKAIRTCIRDLQISDILQRIFYVQKEDIIAKRDETIKEMMETHQFKEAADLIMKHGLVDNFTFDELVLPLILCDKGQIVDELLKLKQQFQKDYIRFFDHLIGETDEYVDSFFDPYKEKGLVKINLNRYHGKSLTTFITKFFNERVKIFKFDLEERRDAPRYEGFMKGKALKYFCMQRFEERAMADEVYFEHVKNTLMQSSSEVIRYYLTLLWDTGYRERRIEVLFWMEYLDTVKTAMKYHEGIQKLLQNPDPTMMQDVQRVIQMRTKSGEEELTEQLYVFEEHQKYPITIVKNEEQLENLCSELDTVEEGVFIGYDSEFKPFHLVDTLKSRMAIMQLFFNKRAFLIDWVELENNSVDDKLVKKFFESLFMSKKLKVIGFDIKNDMEALFTVRAIKDDYKPEDIKNAICVKRFADILNDLNPKILNMEKRTSKMAVLVENLIGWKMDKSEQCGNWQARPLRKNQIVYAALDAVAVVELFLKLLEITKQFEPALDAEKLLKDSHMVMTNVKKEKLKKEAKLLTSMPWSEIYEILHTHRDQTKPLQRISELKILSDTMVLGAGKNLRLLGADVILPRDVNSFTGYINEMKLLDPSEQRYILTVPSKNSDLLMKEHPDLKMILLPNVYSKQPMDLICDFFDNFNLDIRPDDQLLQIDV